MAAIFSIDIAEFPKTEAGMDLTFVMEYICACYTVPTKQASHPLVITVKLRQPSIIVAISAAVVVPLLFVAFNANRIGRLQRSLTQSIRGRSRLTPQQPPSPEVESAPIPRKSLEEGIKELKLADLDTTMARGDDHREDGKARLSMPVLLVLYLCVILPITEIRFAYSLLFQKGGLPMDHVGRRNNDKKDTELTESESNSKEWRLRYELRVYLTFIFWFLRLLLLPIWCCILCVGVLVASVVYGVVSLLLERNPLDALVRDIRQSTLWKF